MNQKKLVIGQIGSGYWGPNVANSIKQTGRAEIKWICDLRPESRRVFKKRHPKVEVTADLADVLGDPKVDAVVIVTPTNTHFAIAKAALEAGKHVLVEKPITTEPEQAQALVDLADFCGRILMVGHVFQYNDTILKLKELIAKGQLGKINYLNIERTNLGPVRTDVNALWDLVSHDTYIMSDLLGIQPKKVSATGWAFLNQDVEDVVFASFDYGGGTVGHVHASWLNPRKVRQITVVGSNKMAIWDDLNLKEPIRVYEKRIAEPQLDGIEGSYLEYKTLPVDGGITIPHVSLNQPLQSECEHFIECVFSGKKPRSDGHAGLAVVKALKAAETSIRLGGAPVEIG